MRSVAFFPFFLIYIIEYLLLWWLMLILDMVEDSNKRFIENIIHKLIHTVHTTVPVSPQFEWRHHLVSKLLPTAHWAIRKLEKVRSKPETENVFLQCKSCALSVQPTRFRRCNNQLLTSRTMPIFRWWPEFAKGLWSFSWALWQV